MSKNITEQEKRALLEKFTKPVAVDMKTVPDNLRCPLSKLIFLDPVSTDPQENDASEVYEREEIAKWLETQDSDPITKQKLASKRLVKDNRTIKDVSFFLNKNTEFRDSNQLYFPPSLVDKLEKACQQEDTKTVQLLCEQDRRLISWTFRFKEENYKRLFGKNIFHLSCQSGTRKGVEELYKQAEARCEELGLFLLLQEDDQGKIPLFYAAQKDSDSDLVRFLSEKMGTHAEKIVKKIKKRERVKQEISPGEQSDEKTQLLILKQMEEIADELEELKEIVKTQGQIIQSQQNIIQRMSIIVSKPPLPSGFLAENRQQGGYYKYPKNIGFTLSELRQRLIEDVPYLPLHPQVKSITAYVKADEKKKEESKDSELEQIEINLVGHKGKIDAMDYLQVDDKEHTLVSISVAEGAARVWDIQTNRCQALLQDKCINLPPVSLYNAHKNHIVIGVQGGANVWDIKQQTCKARLQSEVYPRVMFYSSYLYFSGNGLRYTDVSSLQDEKFKYGDGSTSAVDAITHFPNHHLMGWNPLVMAKDKRINIKINGTLQEIFYFDTDHTITALLPLPDGRLVSSSRDGTIKVWNLSQRICEAEKFCEKTWKVMSQFPITQLRLLNEKIVGFTRTHCYVLSIEDNEFLEFSLGTDKIKTVLPDGRILMAESNNTIQQHYEKIESLIQHPEEKIEINLHFRSDLIRANAQLEIEDKTVTIATSMPPSHAFHYLGQALTAIGMNYVKDEAEQKRKSAPIGTQNEDGTQLTIKTENIKYTNSTASVSTDEIEDLCRAFGVKPALPKVSDLLGHNVFSSSSKTTSSSLSVVKSGSSANSSNSQSSETLSV